MRRYDTVIFDLDGTLLNTLDDLTDSVNFTLSRFAFPLKTTAEVRSFVGNGTERLMDLSIPQGVDNPAYSVCLAEFRRHYAANLHNKTCAYDGILQLVRILATQNFKMAIVSNKFDAAVKKLNRVYFGNIFKVAVGQSENVSKKPAPDSIFKALEKLNASAERAVYIGDSEVDVLTAKNADLQFVGVTWGFRNRADLAASGADCIIDTPDELLPILCKLA